MNPLELMECDMATLKMSSNRVFELWNDSVANNLNNNCIEVVQRDWNMYATDMNVHMSRYMLAEKEIYKCMKKLNELNNK